MAIPNIENLLDEESIYLFVLFNNSRIGFDPFKFCGYSGVVWGGERYIPIPVSISGLSVNTNGSDPQPTITVGDLKGNIGRLINIFHGIEGSEISVERVKRRLLDGGTTPNYLYREPPEVFKVAQKSSQTPSQITYKLKNRIGMKTKIPGRQLNSMCSWKSYRGQGCTYAGVAMFDLNNQPTTDANEDKCALTRKACNLRNNFFNFSGIPTIDNF